MAKLFSGLSVTKDMEKVEDRLGGGRHIFETAVYENVDVKLAYTGLWDSGARYVTVIFDIEGNEFEETITITNSEGQNYYMRDGKKNQMPGFVTINELCLTVTGSELEDQDTEERQIEVWDSTEKKKVRQARDVLVDLTGEKASIALRKATQPKQKKGDDGKYHDTDEDVTINEIVKSFHPETRATVAEIRKAEEKGQDIEAKFIDEWDEKWKGTTYNKRKGGGSSKGSGSGAPAKSSGDKPKSSLFSKS